MKRKSIEFLALATAFFIVLFSNIVFSSSNPFMTGKTCSITWDGDYVGGCNNNTIDDAFGECNGTQSTSAGSASVNEIYINASSFFYGNAINATCEFTTEGSANNSMELWYYDDNSWYMMQYWNRTTYSSGKNYSIIFNVNSTNGVHIIRCMIRKCIIGVCDIIGNCLNDSYATSFDNDDINFTVTSYLVNDFWNLTNRTNGEEVASGSTYNRTINLSVSAHWSKNISEASIEHNGTGSWQNYTIPSPFQENWTNYTLDLSNATEFNSKVIAIKAIYVNDTYSVSNNTSTLLYFNLDAGIPPEIGSSYPIFQHVENSVVTINKYMSLKIIANIYEDVGLDSVTANITYPTYGSVIINLTGDKAPGYHDWIYYFGSTLHLNETGTFKVKVTAKDIGNQNATSDEKTFEVNDTFFVFRNPVRNLYMRGENITFNATDINQLEYIGGAFWIVNLTKIYDTYNLTDTLNIFNYTIKPDDPEGNYSVSANASRDNNTGVDIWQFDVSNNLTLAISTDSILNPGNTINVSVTMRNARGDSHNSPVTAYVTCANNSQPLNFTYGQAYKSCVIPNTYSTPFEIEVLAYDDYNNTGTNVTILTTTSAPLPPPPSGSSPGSSGPPIPPPAKNCTDGTLYNKCSSNRPLYCSNGTLTSKCSVCKCESGYSCQLNEICTLIKAEDFNFTLSREEVAIEQGNDTEIIGHLTNTGNTILNLTIFLNATDCCNFSVPSTILLKEKEEKDFTISIHAPLYAKTGSYLSNIGVGTFISKKEKIFKITITGSRHYKTLEDIEAALEELQREIEDYKKAGIRTNSLESVVNQSKSVIDNLNSSIEHDQVNVLSTSLSHLQDNILNIQTSLMLLRSQKFLLQNSFLIILFVAMCFITIYFVPEVFMPLHKIEKEIKKMKNDEKVLVDSRVETEKQYFMRKLDENTFNKLMITKQDSIFKLRATAREKETERQKILTRMHPVEMLKWFGRGIKNLPRNLKNLSIKAYNKIKGGIHGGIKKQTI